MHNSWPQQQSLHELFFWPALSRTKFVERHQLEKSLLGREYSGNLILPVVRAAEPTRRSKPQNKSARHRKSGRLLQKKRGFLMQKTTQRQGRTLPRKKLGAMCTESLSLFEFWSKVRTQAGPSMIELFILDQRSNGLESAKRPRIVNAPALFMKFIPVDH